MSPDFSNIYELKLPHEMTGKWSIRSSEIVENNGWYEIDVKITTLPSISPSSTATSGSGGSSSFSSSSSFKWS